MHALQFAEQTSPGTLTEPAPRCRARSVLRLAWVLLLAATAPSAQTITSIHPRDGTVGTEISMAGSGFGSEVAGDKPPRVELVPVAGGKNRALKVLTYSDEQIRARVLTATAGPHDLQVRLPGSSTPATAPLPFEVRLPEIQQVQRTEVMSGTHAGVYGDFLGPKGLAWVGDRRAKVDSWSLAATPIGTVDWAIFRVPHGLAPGFHPVRLSNAVGEVVRPDALRVVDAGVPCKPTLAKARAHLQGAGPKTFRAKSGNFVFWAPVELDPREPFEETASAPMAGTVAALHALVRTLLPPGATPEEGADVATTLLAGRPGKIVRAVALVLPDWDPLTDPALLDGSALAHDPLVLYLEVQSETDLRAWAGPATQAEILPGSGFGVTVHALFAADEMILVVGSGVRTMSVTGATICNAPPGSL